MTESWTCFEKFLKPSFQFQISTIILKTKKVSQNKMGLIQKKKNFKYFNLRAYNIITKRFIN